jgi:cobalt-zinc-cadmium efflux system outer membrane protein
LTALSLTAGCVSLPREPGFRGVQDAVRERSDLDVDWHPSDSADHSAEEKVRTLLQEDLTVDRAVAVALLNSRRLQASFEGLEITRADLIQASLPKNPVLGGEIRSPGRPFRPFEISLTQSLLDLLQLRMRRSLAIASFEAAKARTANDVLGFVADVRSEFYGFQASEQVAVMRRKVVDAARVSSELAIRQHDAGNISDLDLENEQALFEQTKLELSRSEGDVLDRRERLSVLLGLFGPETDWRATAGLPDPPAVEPDLENVESQAVSRRLDLLSARHEVEATTAALRPARAGAVGDIDIGVHREREPEGTKTTGPALSVPLPIFPRGRAARARAEAAQRQSQQRYAALAVDARSEVRAARNRVLTARSRVEYYRDVILPRRNRIVTYSQQQYNYMLLGTFQLLLAKQNEITAQLDAIESLRDYWIARTDLERAAGGGLADGEPGHSAAGSAGDALRPDSARGNR